MKSFSQPHVVLDRLNSTHSTWRTLFSVSSIRSSLVSPMFCRDCCFHVCLQLPHPLRKSYLLPCRNLNMMQARGRTTRTVTFAVDDEFEKRKEALDKERWKEKKKAKVRILYCLVCFGCLPLDATLPRIIRVSRGGGEFNLASAFSRSLTL